MRNLSSAEILVRSKLNDYYKSIMIEIIRRANVIYSIYYKRFTTNFLLTDMEFCSLQFRKIIELLLVSTLIANKEEYEKQSIEFEKNWNLDKKFKEINSINPDFFPMGISIINSATLEQANDIIWYKRNPKGLFKKKDFKKAHKFASGYLHVQNPFNPVPLTGHVDGFYHDLIDYLNRIINLLEKHIITLCNRDYLYCEISRKGEKEIQIDMIYFKVKESKNILIR